MIEIEIGTIILIFVYFIFTWRKLEKIERKMNDRFKLINEKLDHIAIQQRRI